MLLLCVLPWEQTTLRAEIQIREVFLFFFPESIIKISKQKKNNQHKLTPNPEGSKPASKAGVGHPPPRVRSWPETLRDTSQL